MPAVTSFIARSAGSVRRMAIGAAALVALAACDVPVVGPTAGVGPRVDTSRPVQVALLVPGGSGDQGRQTLAVNLENAARMAVADLQGVQIDLRVYNTAGDPARAAQQAQAAVRDGAVIILGPLFGEAASAAGRAVANTGVNVLSFSNTTSVAGGNVFVLGPTFENTATRLLSHAAANGRGRVMVVSEQSESGAAALRAIDSAAARSSATIVARQSYPFSQQGIVGALPVITESANSSGAQTILLTAGSEGALPLLAQLMPENGLRPDRFQFMGLTRWDIPPATLELAGLQGGWFTLPDPGLSAQFENRFRARFGGAPHPVAALGYDGIAAVGALIRRGGNAPLSRQAITQGSGFAGVTGVFRFLPDGTVERGLAVAEIRDNRVRIISPAPRSFTGSGS